MNVFLNKYEMESLYRTKREHRNNGGFQSFLVKMQDRVNDCTGELELNSTDVDTIIQYYHYGNGGYQSRLRKIFGRHLPFIFDKELTPMLPMDYGEGLAK